MEFKDLQKIGLTKGEIKVYKAVLELGECTKSPLAETSGVAPSNIYNITSRLSEKGMISIVKKNGVFHFSPSHPARIMDFIRNKEKEIENEKKFVASLMPLLVSKFQKTRERVTVEVFEGWGGLKTVFADMIDECEKGDKTCVFGASEGDNKERSDRFFLKYSKKREKKGIKTSIIFNESLRSRKERIEHFLESRMYEVRFLNQSTSSEVLIYRDYVCIIILVEDPLCIRIRGSEVSRSFIQYFDVMWRQASV